MTEQLIQLDYAPRLHFIPFHCRKQRWAALACHRRAGKTVAVINDQVKRAITLDRPDGRLGYIAPYRGQAKEIAWAYLKKYSEPLWAKEPSESELRVHLLNSSSVRLYGGDNPDAIRGGYFDDVVLDEFADHRLGLWSDVVRPMLADRHGSATFIGTPKGKNEFYKIFKEAERRPDEWFSLHLPAGLSGIIPQAELDSMLMEMGTDRYMQEMECSWEAAIHGAFYAEELRRAQEQGRIRELQPDRALRVHTAWDLGYADSTAIWFVQCIGQERRLIDYYETSGVGLDHYVQVLEEKRRSKSNPDGYLYGNHYFPHDIGVHELTSGQSRKSTLEGLGIDVTTVSDFSVLDGINAVRRMLDRTFIDPIKCDRGLEALRNYRREYDERLKDWKTKPLHDWSSHACFVGETEVLTYNGACRISDLPSRGKVWTQHGWRPYQNPRITRTNAPLVEVHFVGGLTVKCTADHLFLTESGWKSAQHLQRGTKIQSSLTPSPNTSKENYLGFGPKSVISRKAESGSTMWSGALYLAHCLMVATSIIGMKIRSITHSAIWSVCPYQSTCPSPGILGSKRGEFTHSRQGLGSWPLRGTNQRLGFFGIGDTLSAPRVGANGKERTARVLDADKYSVASLDRMGISKNIVPKNARRWLTGNAAARLLSLTESALSAAKAFASKCILAARTVNFARSNVTTAITIAGVFDLAERSDVWCLSVPDARHFSLANGAVVHNCDALRMFAVGHDEPDLPLQEDRHRRNREAPQSAWGV